MDYVALPNMGRATLLEALPRIEDEARYGTSLPKEWQQTVLDMCRVMEELVCITDFDETELETFKERLEKIREEAQDIEGAIDAALERMKELPEEEQDEIDEFSEDDLTDLESDIDEFQNKLDILIDFKESL